MKRLGKHLNPTTGIAFVALIFAVTGVSFAATGGGGGSGSSAGFRASASSGTLTATASKAKPKPKPKVVKGPAGPKGATGVAGATGAPGAVGPAGLAGPAGPAGPKGDIGPAGANGTNGTNGTNGKDGENGETGFTETLPEGMTETGAWAVAGPEFEGSKDAVIPISFAIPLAETIDEESQTVIMKTGEAAKPGCIGGTVAEPKAEPGFLCIYTAPNGSLGSNPAVLQTALTGIGASRTGAYIRTEELKNGAETGEATIVTGTWAVTAPEA